jgi:hypothetical protein
MPTLLSNLKAVVGHTFLSQPIEKVFIFMWEGRPIKGQCLLLTGSCQQQIMAHKMCKNRSINFTEKFLHQTNFFSPKAPPAPFSYI